MNLAGIAKIDDQARRIWTYKADAPGVAGNLWRSFAAEVLAGKSWAGDCSDLVATVNDLLAQAGVPLEKLYRVIVASGLHGEVPDHQVGAVEDDAGEMWVVADTGFSRPYNPHGIHYRACCYNRLSEASALGAQWREGYPWQ